MSCRKNLIVAVLFGAVFCATSSLTPAQTGRGTGLVILPFRAVDSESQLVRGQDEAATKKGPSLLDRLKKTLSNFTKDDDSPDAPAKDRVRDPLPRSQAIPTTPPKPITSLDVRQAIDEPDAVEEKRPSTSASQVTTKASEPIREHGIRESLIESPRTTPTADITGPSNNESIYKRLESIRNTVFEASPAAPPSVAAKPSPPPAPREQHPTTLPTQRPTSFGTDPPPGHPASPMVSQRLTRESERQPMFAVGAQRKIAMSSEPVNEAGGDDAIGAGSIETKSDLRGIAGIDVVRKPDSPWDRTDRSGLNTSRQTVETPEPSTVSRSGVPLPQRNATVLSTEREKSLLVGPLIELETVAASKVIVGQEAAYQIRVINRGGAPAEQVALTVEIPNWIDVLPPDVSSGTTSITSRGPNSDLRDFVWKIAKVEAKTEEQIVLRLVPKQRQTVDLKIAYDYHKPSAVTKIVVQEPVLAMELQGPSEVLWGSNVSYKLLVRNTGNGDAENIKLELLQTGSDMKSCEIPLLKAGEEEAINVEVWTGKQDHHVDINIQATGPYDLTATAVKRIIVMRPELSVQVEAPEMLFVGNAAEFTVRVQNNGNATAKNVELAATIPLGAKHVSHTAGGRLTPPNQVLWNIEAIPSSGEFVATVVCEMKREGNCKLEAVVGDTSGLLAGGFGNVNVEAIAELKMHLDPPQGPVEVGQEAVFVINIINRGTKTAENVEVIAAFARGLEPYAIEGANGTMSDGQVIFDIIPAISAGQTVTLKVKGKADRSGNHRVRAEVICQAVHAHIVNEQATYFYQKQRGRAAFMAESPSTAGMPGVEQSAAPLAVQHPTTSQPLQNAPSTATKAWDPLR